jgi:citrate synthase
LQIIIIIIRGATAFSLHLCTSFTVVFKGDRFGGALDGAAKQFSEAYDSGLHPMEFVNSMRKKGQLIMGIGHRVKSVSKHQ